MSDVLARLRVRETHGIRRFLFPLAAEVDLPADVDAAAVGLVGDGQPVPIQVTPLGGVRHRLDFAVSLAPSDTIDLLISRQGQRKAVDDPLQILELSDASLRSEQQRFALTIQAGNLQDVVYDGVHHLRGLSSVLRIGRRGVGETMKVIDTQTDFGPLSASMRVLGRYEGKGVETTQAELRTEITACKSWVNMTYRLDTPGTAERVWFHLPFAMTAPVLTYDMGAGGGIYGKLCADSPNDVFWNITAIDTSSLTWSIRNCRGMACRFDYTREGVTRQELQSQLFFHLIDEDKALAVAITKMPDSCQAIEVNLSHGQGAGVSFQLADHASGPAEFGVCYHFLNDIPAIAAATNPQSILLPLTVEVLPA